MRLEAELDRIAVGQAVAIDVTDPAFAADAPAWCHSTGNEFVGIHRKNGSFRAMAAFIIANGAAAMGSQVTLFFTFWGLNILRKPEPVKVKKTLIERMFGWMMPRGAKKLTLSKMHMGGMGTAMIRGIMRKKKVASLPR